MPITNKEWHGLAETNKTCQSTNQPTFAVEEQLAAQPFAETDLFGSLQMLELLTDLRRHWLASWLEARPANQHTNQPINHPTSHPANHSSYAIESEVATQLFSDGQTETNKRAKQPTN